MCAVKIRTETAGWSRRYQTALRNHLKQGSGASVESAIGLGRQAVALRLETLDLAPIHEQALMSLVSTGAPPRTRRRMIERATRFFAEPIVPIERTHRAARKTDLRVRQLIQTLRRRTAESSASARHLERGIAQRQAAESALQESGKHRLRLSQESSRRQNRLRHQTRKILSVQESQRQNTSRRLQDEIAQILLAVNLRLLTLRTSSRANTASLKKEIAETQGLVTQSAKTITRLAHESGIPHKT